jgi:hypothetical protein
MQIWVLNSNRSCRKLFFCSNGEAFRANRNKIIATERKNAIFLTVSIAGLFYFTIIKVTWLNRTWFFLHISRE